MTNHYNQFICATDPTDCPYPVTAASRSTLILKGSKQVIFYDRATTGVAEEKSVYMNTTGAPTISGNQTKWTTQSGAQDAYLTSLLPTALVGTGGELANGTVTTAGSPHCSSWSVSGSGAAYPWGGGGSSQLMTVIAGTGGYSSAPTPTPSGCTAVGTTTVNSLTAVVNNIGLSQAASSAAWDWELTGGASTVQVNAGVATAAQFMNVLEWGAHSFTKSTTTLVSSSAGQNFDGALIGPSLVMFERAWPAAATGTTFPASGATTIYVSDLSPNTSYAVTGAGTPGTVTTDTAGVATFAATGTGNITIGTSVGSGGSVKSGTVVSSGNVTQ
jgi:hypothetical protein